MLQIHYDADRYDRDFDNKPIGKFTVPSNAPYKCMDCNGKCDRYSNISNTVFGNFTFCPSSVYLK